MGTSAAGEQAVSMMMGEEASLKGSYWRAAVVKGITGKRPIIDNSNGIMANLGQYYAEEGSGKPLLISYYEIIQNPMRQSKTTTKKPTKI